MAIRMKTKISLKVKTIFSILLITLTIAATAIIVSYNIYANTMDEHYETMAVNLSATEATMIDSAALETVMKETLAVYDRICEENGGVPDFDHFTEGEWEAYFERYEKIEQSVEYQDNLAVLREIAGTNDVRSIYVCYMDLRTGKAIYIIDGSLENACEIGTCDNIEEKNRLLMEAGDYNFPAYITNYEEYGWLCSASSAIYNDAGEVIGNAYVDISMDEVIHDRQMFFIRLCMILAGITVMLILLFVWVITKTVVSPINRLAYAAGTFVTDKERHSLEKEASEIAKLRIRTGDEIENLTDSIQTMEKEINTYIDNLTAVTAEKERIGAELNVATQIQADMLPNIFPAFPEHVEFDVYATMDPAKEVGGDFYDFFMVDENHLAIVMADVSGKGVPAALFMVIAKTLIKNHAQNGESPAQVFTNVNNQLCENNEVGMFVTGWMGVMEIETGKMTYVNAGHNYPVIIRRDGTVEWVKSRPGFVLAGMENTRYRQNEVDLQEGDTIYLYTDGVTEALDEQQELYGEDRLEKVLSQPEIKGMKPEHILCSISKDLKVFAGEAEQADDITMLALYRCTKGEKKNGSWKEIRVRAVKDEWLPVSAFLEEQLEEVGCHLGVLTQILIAAEEIFVNIASYAYGDGGGNASVKTLLDENNNFHIRFEDGGIPYNPLAKADPNISLTAEERGIGGLGIFMVKKSMDDVQYEYKDDMNCLTLVKQIKK